MPHSAKNEESVHARGKDAGGGSGGSDSESQEVGRGIEWRDRRRRNWRSRERSRSRGCPGSPEGGWGYTKQGLASEMEVPATITPLVIPIQIGRASCSGR